MPFETRSRFFRVDPPIGFDRDVRVVVFLLFAFTLFYLLLLAASFGLLFAAILGAVFLFSLAFHWISIVLGLGLLGFGGMVVTFMVKFLFRVNRSQPGTLIEVDAHSQPEFIAYVHSIAIAVGAPLPKNVLLVPDVNASVRYDSSFWSMFLPIRKNLHVGLGLLNSLTQRELEAVLAHEFGHFAQRSMKLGSYVYRVNRTVHALVFEQDAWDSTLVRWMSMGGVLGLFAHATQQTVMGLRWLLRQAYFIVNKAYLRLSRSMEFHADNVAGALCGGPALIKALRKLTLAERAYQSTLERLGARAERDKLRSIDIYADHRAMMATMAGIWVGLNEAPFSHEMLDKAATLNENTGLERLVVKDQWASHPSIEERESNLAKFPESVLDDGMEAWAMLRNQDALRERMTMMMYDNERSKELQPMLPGDFAQQVRSERDRMVVDQRFNGYFDDRLFSAIEPAKLSGEPALGASNLFTKSNVSRIQRRQFCEQELNVMRGIAKRELKLSSFEFDGVKMTKRRAKDLVPVLEVELKELDAHIQACDASVLMHAQGVLSEPDWTDLLVVLQELQLVQLDMDALKHVLNKGMQLHERLTSKALFEEVEMHMLRVDGEALERSFRRALGEMDLEKLALAGQEPTVKALREFAASHSRVWHGRFDTDQYAEIMELLNHCIAAVSSAHMIGVKALADALLPVLALSTVPSGKL